ncbi:MAG: hypothetical protein KA007_02375 [Candidatus Pacebacteria bacterium]|jgi:Ran GTPase-activating protein (RanGAP) involved in mRNA processing and transport|nr:hypothetical protein [Candidatus Paceibacterota bacterium]
MKEYIEKILQSNTLSSEAKEKIKALSSGEISADTIIKIEHIIQSEIDSVFDEAGIKVDQNELDSKMSEMEANLSEIENNVKEDSEIVKKELENLEKITDDISESLDQDKAEDLKKEILQ